MSTDYKTLGIGGVAGLILGAVLTSATSGPDMDTVRKDFAGTVESATQDAVQPLTASVSAVSDDVSALSDSMDASLSGVAERMESAAAAQAATTQDRLAALEARLAEVAAAQAEAASARAEAADARAAMRERMAGVIAEHGETLAGIRTSVAALGDRIAAAGASASAGEAAPTEPAIEKASAPVAEVIPGSPAGNVEMLLDGALRVFISGVDEQNGTARVAINGIETEVLRVGRPTRVVVDGQDCTVTLDAVDRGHAQVSGRCDDA